MTAATAQQEAQAALRATSTDALLGSIIVLTHRIHSSRSRLDDAALRRQRDLIRAEILRRTGDV